MSNNIKHEKNGRLAWLYGSETGRWLVALAVSGAILAAVYACIVPVFMTIDDARLRYIYAGYSTGEPVSTYLFSYSVISWILSKLYTWMPGFHWYAFYQFALIGLSSAVIGKTCYKICRKKGISYVAAIAIHVVLYLSVALVCTILMHFEVTAAMAGTASVALLLGMDIGTDKKSVAVLDLLLACVLLTASFVIQDNAFMSAACYTLVALVWLALRAVKKRSWKAFLKRTCAFGMVTVTLLTSVVMLDNASKDTPEWDAYFEYNKYRVSFWDYPHITYEDDPALFEEMGWTENFYDLVSDMYFMDERFNKENLSRFTEEFSWFDFESPSVMLATMKQTLAELLMTEGIATLQALMLFLLSCLVLAKCCRKRNWQAYFPELISSLCCSGGTVVLILFLCSRGRFPLRAWLAISIPAITVLSVLLLRMLPEKRAKGCPNLRRILAAVVLGAWAVAMFAAYRPVVRSDWQWRNQRSYTSVKMEEYCAAHPENVYVYDHFGAQNYSVFSLYPDADQRPSNAFVWGSSYIFTPAYYEQLEANGRDCLMTEDLFDDNVYFIAQSSGRYSFKLFCMLREIYPDVYFEPIESIVYDQFVVYKIHKS